MIVELYGGPADGAREMLRTGMPPLIVRHVYGSPGDRRWEWVTYDRCPDGTPYEQLAARDGTMRLMVHNGQKEAVQ